MKKKRIIIIISIVIVVLLVLLLIPKGNGTASSSVKSETLAPKTLQSTISTSGVVASTDSKNVYSSLNYPIKSISAKVGDIVKAGDVLAIIDSKDLSEQIASREASMKSSNVNIYYQLSQSQKRYNEAKNNLENGMNVELNSADAALKSAEIDLNNAKTKFESLQKSQNDANSEKILAAKTEFTNAENNFKYSKDDYAKAVSEDVTTNKDALSKLEAAYQDSKEKLNAAKASLLNAQGKDSTIVASEAQKVSDAQKLCDDNLKAVYNEIKTNNLEMARKQLEMSEKAYDAARDSFDKIVKDIGGELSQVKQALDNAQINYDRSKKSYDATKLSVNQQLESLKTEADKNQEIISSDSQLVELDNLKKKLDDCTVKSPIAGTVTSVNGIEGAPANGVLFVVEDTKSIKINAKIKEYDIGNIAPNMKVVIKSDATGDQEYEGVISRVAPTATKDSMNADTQFDFEVTVNSQDTKLLIGMNARLKVVTQEKQNILSVRYDAITKNKDNKDVVYVAKLVKGDLYTVEEVPVTTGIENDFEAEISGENIKAGTIIITDIDNIKVGSTVRLSK